LELKNQLKNLGIEKIDSVLLYLFSLQYDINIELDISKEDMALIKKHKLAKRNYKNGSYDTILGKGERTSTLLKVVEERVDEYRLLFKNTGIPGKMGDRNACIKKLVKFLEIRPQITMDEVIEVARYYCQNYKQITNYLQQADYFIEKNGQSRLAALYDERPQHVESNEYGGNLV